MKKIYIQPATEVIYLDMQYSVLQASGINGGTVDNSDGEDWAD